MRGARSGVSYVVSVAIISMVTIALGLFLWGITAGWAGVSAFDMVKETNKGVAQQRSLLVVEFVDMRNRVVWVSNPGKVDLVILSCLALFLFRKMRTGMLLSMSRHLVFHGLPRSLM